MKANASLGFKVDGKDLARASGAFGSYLGHSKWNMVCDITGDHKIDIKDLAKVSARFGWYPQQTQVWESKSPLFSAKEPGLFLRTDKSHFL